MNAGGLVEMHAHILPGMDDGSKSVEMSIEMLHRLAEMGVAEVCGDLALLRGRQRDHVSGAAGHGAGTAAGSCRGAG